MHDGDRMLVDLALCAGVRIEQPENVHFEYLA